MSPRSARSRVILRIHFHPAERSGELYGQLLNVLDGISSRVEPLPADWSAYVDLTGALTYWGSDVEGLVAVLRQRLLAPHGVPSSAGAGPTRSIAAMAADVTPPGAATVVRDDPYEIAAFLRTKPTAALPGIGPKNARTLARYGITTVGDIADTQLPTLQRILGTGTARQAHDLAHGIDERPVVPGAAPKTMSAGHRFARDELGPRPAPPNRPPPRPGTRRPAAHQRRDHPDAHAHRHLRRPHPNHPQPHPHRTHRPHPALAATARELLTSLGLQRARVLALRAEHLRPSEHTVHQLTFDDRDHKLRRLETALDRAAIRSGPGIAGAASTFPPVG